MHLSNANEVTNPLWALCVDHGNVLSEQPNEEDVPNVQIWGWGNLSQVTQGEKLLLRI